MVYYTCKFQILVTYVKHGCMKNILIVIFALTTSATAFAQTSAHSTIEKQQVYRYVDQMPKASYDVNKYLKDNMRYPEQARAEGVKGRVIVDFTMQTNGKATNITARNSFRYASLAEEAIRLIKDMPAWAPGKKDGVTVNVAMTQTVIFMP